MHGHDLTPLLEDPESNWPHPVLISQTNRTFGSATSPLPVGEDAYHNDCPWYVSLTKGRYKYIRYLAAGEGEEFYDLQDDPDELQNLAAKTTPGELISDYRDDLSRELRRTGAPFVNSMPDIR